MRTSRSIMYDWTLHHGHEVTLVWKLDKEPLHRVRTALMTVDHASYYKVYAVHVTRDIAHTVICFDYLKMYCGLASARPILVYGLTKDTSRHEPYLVWKGSSSARIVEASELDDKYKEDLHLMLNLRRLCKIGPYGDSKKNKYILIRNRLIGLEYTDYGNKYPSYDRSCIPKVISKIKAHTRADRYTLIESQCDPKDASLRAVRGPHRTVISLYLMQILLRLHTALDI